MGFLSKIFPKEKKKEGPNLKAIDYEMESLERELREYEQQRQTRGGQPPRPPVQQGQPQVAQPMQPAPYVPPPQPQAPPPSQAPPPQAQARPLGQPRGIIVTDTKASANTDEVRTYEQPPEHEVRPMRDMSNAKTVDLETSSTVMDTGSEKVVDQDFRPVQEEPAGQKDISEVSVILPVTPEEELKEPEEAKPPEQVLTPQAEPAPEQQAEAAETTQEMTMTSQEGPAPELAPAPELTPVAEEPGMQGAVQETKPEPAQETKPEPALEAQTQAEPAAPVQEAPTAQKRPKKPEGSPDGLVAKLDDILKVLEKKVAASEASGKDMTEAKKLVTEAREHFNAKRYKTAKELAVKVKQSVV